MVKRLFRLSLALAIVLGVYCIGCAAQEGSGWKQVSRCKFTFAIPLWLNEKKEIPIDSCIARFEGEGLTVVMDHGHYSGVPKQWDLSKDFRESSIMLGKTPARLFTYHLESSDGSPYQWITAVYVETSRQKKRETLSGSALLFEIITDKKPNDTVQQIYKSLRYYPSKS